MHPDAYPGRPDPLVEEPASFEERFNAVPDAPQRAPPLSSVPPIARSLLVGDNPFADPDVAQSFNYANAGGAAALTSPYWLPYALPAARIGAKAAWHLGKTYGLYKVLESVVPSEHQGPVMHTIHEVLGGFGL